MFTSKLYCSSPIFLQNFLLSVRALIRKKLRENKKSKQLMQVLLENEVSSEKLERYTKERLSEVLNYSTVNVPKYQNQKKEIHTFPYISKEDIREAPNDFFDTQYKGAIINGSTSGTTGSPLTIPQNMESVIREQAFISRSLHWAGFKKGDKRAWIRGDLIVPLSQKKAPFWRYSYFEDMILLSSFHMTAESLPKYIEAMVDYGVDVIQAYPSSIVTIAKYLKENGLFYPGKIKSILTSSESLSQDDKALLEERFKCKVFDWYGLFERVAAIASCEAGKYHILTDYSYVEFLPAGETNDGRRRAEIVGTNFNNSTYPLIRYKTGDHVVLSNNVKCDCGRTYPVIDSIEGRDVQHVFNQSGEKIYALDQCVKGAKGIIGSQFVQFQAGEITLNVIADKAFNKEQQAIVTENIKARLGQEIDVKFEFVSELKKTKSGKAIQAICHIEEGNGT